MSKILRLDEVDRAWLTCVSGLRVRVGRRTTLLIGWGLSQESPGPESREQRRQRWLRNEAELERLRDLPAGAVDPAAREAQLDEEQDQIDYEAGLD